jgi:hypothetical protein
MARSSVPRPPHARPSWSGCPVCGDDHPAQAHPRQPWTAGELLAAGWCAGVFTMAAVGFLARVLA